MAAAGRKCRFIVVLHVRDHWQSERRDVHTSFHAAARNADLHDRRVRLVGCRLSMSGHTHVSRQCLGPALCGRDGRSAAVVSRASAGRRQPLLMRDEGATAAIGVPTIWLQFQQYVQAQSLQPIKELRLKRVLIGGAAAPHAVVETFEKHFGVRVLHAWGMTETSPLGTLCNPLQKHQQATEAQRIHLQSKQARAPYGVSLKITDNSGTALPHDGLAAGHLLVRGHWIAAAYFRAEGGSILDADGWFDTGDIATIDPDGYMQITDRAKDVIKSGGEWISSIDLENAAVGHTSVAEAAAIGLPHPVWQERPLLVVVRKAGHEVTKDELLAYLSGKVAKWWLPNAIVFVAQLPHTATGKLQKMTLRETFKDYRFDA